MGDEGEAALGLVLIGQVGLDRRQGLGGESVGCPCGVEVWVGGEGLGRGGGVPIGSCRLLRLLRSDILQFDRSPAHCEEVLLLGCDAKPAWVEWAHRDRGNRGDRRAVLVDGLDRDPLAGAHPYPEPGSAARLAQRDSVEGEGQAHPLLDLLWRGGEERRVDCRVEQRRMHPEALCFRALLLGERYLRIDLLPHPPCRLQALEGGAVVQADRGYLVIEALAVDRLPPGGWPLARRKARRLSVFLGAEGARGMQGPSPLFLRRPGVLRL